MHFRKICTLFVLFAVLAVIAPSIATVGAQEFADIPNGTYIGEGEGYHDYIEVEVTVKKGKITKLKTLYCEDTNGLWQAARDGVFERILEQQTTDVDVVTAATGSSNGFIEAVKNALKQ